MTTQIATIKMIDPLLIDFDPTQPRQEIDADTQGDLTVSVREQGIVTPIRAAATGSGRYVLLYGERRLRAALANELIAVPCIVHDTAPTWTEALDVQLTENLHRADLRPLEVAQTLWRRILGANIAALEAEQGDDGQATETLLASYLTPTGQIAALEDRLCALAEVGDVTAYFGGGRVRVPRKTILARYGMAEWSESRLKKLFQTLDVEPVVQDMLAGIDVSARMLRDLRHHDAETQGAMVAAAKADPSGDVTGTLRNLLKPSKHHPEQANEEPEDADNGVPGTPERGQSGGANTFTPDPALAFLTTTNGHAPKLVTDQVAPRRGTPPPVTETGVWSDDALLQIEGALDAALTICDDMGVMRLGPDQSRRLRPLWEELATRLAHVGLEEVGHGV